MAEPGGPSIDNRQQSSAGLRFGTIIVNYNGAGTLNEAIRSVVLAGVPEHQVALIDNGSADTSVAEAESEFPQIQVHRMGCNSGFAKAVNRGLQLLATEFVLLLNNDAEIAPNALEAFAAAFDTYERLGMAGAQLRYPDGRLQSAFSSLPSLTEEIVPMNFLKWAQPERYVRVTESMVGREVESAFGACLAVRMAAVVESGMMDEEFFFYFEEVEWCRRIQLHGWKIRYVPDAKAVHLLGHTTKRFRSDARIEMQRSKLLYFRKCSGAAAYFTLSIFLVFRSFINAFFGLLGCVGTLFLQAKLRHKARAYTQIFLWHMLGRPSSWGLPGKCPGSVNPR